MLKRFTYFIFLAESLVEERLAIPMLRISMNSEGYTVLKMSKKFQVTLKRSSIDNESSKSPTSTLRMGNLFSTSIGSVSSLFIQLCGSAWYSAVAAFSRYWSGSRNYFFSPSSEKEIWGSCTLLHKQIQTHTGQNVGLGLSECLF